LVARPKEAVPERDRLDVEITKCKPFWAADPRHFVA
jgi:hypothetical protein